LPNSEYGPPKTRPRIGPLQKKSDRNHADRKQVKNKPVVTIGKRLINSP
jgi:hypothetical protein